MLGEACNRRKVWVERMEINGSMFWSARMQLKKGRKRILGYYETEREAKRRCGAAATADCIPTTNTAAGPKDYPKVPAPLTDLQSKASNARPGTFAGIDTGATTSDQCGRPHSCPPLGCCDDDVCYTQAKMDKSKGVGASVQAASAQPHGLPRRNGDPV